MRGTDWELLGREDPYYAVLSDARYRTDRDAFFASGRGRVETVMATIRRLDPAFRPSRVLDFGCGVGRVLRPLAEIADEVVGVDVAPSMLAEAARNCAGMSNIELADRAVGTFDLIHSFIVFQHIPPRRGMAILRELLAMLRPGGIGVVHFTFADHTPGWARALSFARHWVPLVNRLLNIARGRSASYPFIEMHRYDLAAIYTSLDDAGCREFFGTLTDHGGHLGVVLYFQKPTAER